MNNIDVSEEPRRKRTLKLRNAVIGGATAIIAAFFSMRAITCSTVREDPKTQPVDAGSSPNPESSLRTLSNAAAFPARRKLAAAVISDGGILDGSVSEIREKCLSLATSGELGESEEIYNALLELGEIFDPKDPAMLVYDYELQKIAQGCGWTLEKVMNILQGAIDQNDTRVARVVNNEIEKQCDRYLHDFHDVVSLERIEELEQPCSAFMAGQYDGLDIEKVQALAAQQDVKQLATLRLAFLNTDYTPTFVEAKDYLMAVDRITSIVFLIERDTISRDEIFKALGVKDKNEFKAKYIDAVAKSLSCKGSCNIWLISTRIQFLSDMIETFGLSKRD